MQELDDPAPTAKHDVAAFIIIGIIGIPLLALAVGALVLPPGMSFALIRRGLTEAHPSWVALGAIIALLWLAMLYATGKKLLHRSARA